MRRALLRTRKGRVALLAGSLGFVVLLAVCSYWRIWSFEDFSLALRLRRHHSPVAHALWRGEIRPGDRIDRVISMSRPNSIYALGPFLSIDYYPSGDLPPNSISLEATSLTAKDGRLLSAVSYGCTFERTYFDLLTDDENALYDRLLRERIEAGRNAAR